MFFASTTIWNQQSNTNPLNTKERRCIFAIAGTVKAVPGKIGTAFSKASVITRPVTGILKILTWPITLPTRIAWWSGKQGYNYAVKPITKATSIVAGSTVEAGAGTKDAVVNSVTEIGKAPLVNLKMNLWDLPKHNIDSAIRLPGDVIKMPKRFLYDGHKEMFQDIPKNAKILVTNTRKNIGDIFSNLAKLRPIKTIGSFVRTVRDGINDVIVRPAISHLKPITTPIKPITNKIKDAVKIIYESKKQYLTQIVQAGREFVKGLTRIKNAPGHELNAGALQNIRGKIATNLKDMKDRVLPKRAADTAPAQQFSGGMQSAPAPA